MWTERNIDSLFSKPICSKCNEDLHFFEKISLDYALKCNKNYHVKKISTCNICKSQSVICFTCLKQLSKQSERIGKSQTINSTDLSNNWFCSKFTVYFAGTVIFLSVLLSFTNIFSINKNMNVTFENEKAINKLRKHYPSQKNETWYHFMSALENEIPTVKSIMLLHGEDRSTSECLINELVFLYIKNKSIKIQEITFSALEYEVKDYGIVLEHYRQIVERFRIFITDLNKVNGNIARIFHSLCDEVSSNVRPSLFIFTLKYDKRAEDIKPIERATSILKETWKDLPENEIFPLFSRIIKNVIDIIPEEKEYCRVD